MTESISGSNPILPSATSTFKAASRVDETFETLARFATLGLALTHKYRRLIVVSSSVVSAMALATWLGRRKPSEAPPPPKPFMAVPAAASAYQGTPSQPARAVRSSGGPSGSLTARFDEVADDNGAAAATDTPPPPKTARVNGGGDATPAAAAAGAATADSPPTVSQAESDLRQWQAKAGKKKHLELFHYPEQVGDPVVVHITAAHLRQTGFTGELAATLKHFKSPRSAVKTYSFQLSIDAQGQSVSIAIFLTSMSNLLRASNNSRDADSICLKNCSLPTTKASGLLGLGGLRDLELVNVQLCNAQRTRRSSVHGGNASEELETLIHFDRPETDDGHELPDMVDGNSNTQLNKWEGLALIPGIRGPLVLSGAGITDAFVQLWMTNSHGSLIRLKDCIGVSHDKITSFLTSGEGPREIVRGDDDDTLYASRDEEGVLQLSGTLVNDAMVNQLKANGRQIRITNAPNATDAVLDDNVQRLGDDGPAATTTTAAATPTTAAPPSTAQRVRFADMTPSHSPARGQRRGEFLLRSGRKVRRTDLSRVQYRL